MAYFDRNSRTSSSEKRSYAQTAKAACYKSYLHFSLGGTSAKKEVRHEVPTEGRSGWIFGSVKHRTFIVELILIKKVRFICFNNKYRACHVFLSL